MEYISGIEVHGHGESEGGSVVASGGTGRQLEALVHVHYALRNCRTAQYNKTQQLISIHTTDTDQQLSIYQMSTHSTD